MVVHVCCVSSVRVAVAAEREGPGAPAVVLAAAPLAGRQVDVDNLSLGTLDQAAVSAVNLRGVTQEALNERIKIKVRSHQGK